MALQRKHISAANALARLEDLCARSERCGWELREKLRRWGIGNEDSEKILAHLRAGRYYDDSRFAEAFVRDKLLYSRWGRRKIRLGLMARRIDEVVAEEALAGIDDEEYRQILLTLAKAKARRVKDADTYEGRVGVFRFLISRGFEPGLVSEVMRSGEIV